MNEHSKNEKGCGKMMHIIGTNGGLMPCGSTLLNLDGTKARPLCDDCKQKGEHNAH